MQRRTFKFIITNGSDPKYILLSILTIEKSLLLPFKYYLKLDNLIIIMRPFRRVITSKWFALYITAFSNFV